MIPNNVGDPSAERQKIADLKARLSTAEGRIGKLLAHPHRCDDCPGGEDWQQRAERAEVVVEAVKNCAHLSAYCTCRDAIRQYEEAVTSAGN